MQTMSTKAYHTTSMKTVMLGSAPQLLQTLVTGGIP